MSWSERTACRVSVPLNSAVSSQLVTLPTAANPGDVVVVVTVAGGGPTTTASGLAGTWTAERENVTSPGLSVLIGTGITVAGTTFTVSGIGGTTGVILATVLSGITDGVGGIGTVVHNAVTATTSVSTSGTPITATAGRCMVAAASHPGSSSTPNINAATWSTGDTDTQAVHDAGGSGTWRNASLDLATPAASGSMSVSYSSGTTGDWNVIQIELIPSSIVGLAGASHGVGSASGAVNEARVLAGASHGVATATGSVTVTSPLPRIGPIAVTDTFDRSRNLLAAADPSFEAGITGWTPDTGGPTLTDSTGTGRGGGNSLRLTAVAAGDVATARAAIATVVAGTRYILSWYVNPSVGRSAYADIAGAASQPGAPVTVPAGVYTRCETSFVAGSSGAINVFLHNASPAGGGAAGQTIDIDDVQIEVAVNEWATVYGRDPSFAGGGLDSWSSGFASGPNNVADPDGSGGKAITVTRTVSDSDSTNGFATAVTLQPNTTYVFTAKVRSTADTYWFPGADGSLGSVGASSGQFIAANTSAWITWTFTTDTDVSGFFVMRVNGNAGFTLPLAVGTQIWLTDIHLSGPALDVTPFTWGDATHLGSSDDGHAWEQGVYTTGVLTGQAYVADHGADNTIDCGTSEMDVQVDVILSGGGGVADGLDVRFIDFNNYVRVDLYYGGDVARVIGVVGGSGIQVVNSAALGLVAGVPYRLRSITVGDWVRVFVNSALVIDTHLDHAVMLATGSATRAGLHSDWSAHWDNFTVAAGSIARGVATATGSLTVTLPLSAAGSRSRGGSVSLGIIPLIAPPAGTPGQGWEWNGRTRDGLAIIDLEPAVDPDPPNRSAVILKTVTNLYPAPTIIAGRPYNDASGAPWEPHDTEGAHDVWGKYRVVIAGRDRTWVRGEQTLITDYSDEDPGGPATLTVVFPAVTSWDELDAGDLEGIKTDSMIVVQKRNPDGSYARDAWAGELGVETDTLVDSGSGAPASYLTFSCRGWWLVLDDFITLPRVNPDPIEAASFIEGNARRAHLYGWPAHIPYSGITGLLIPERGEYGAPLGSQTITNALKLMQRRNGNVYTVAWTGRKTLEIVERVWGGPYDFSFRIGQRGLSHTLTRDPTLAFTAIYGRGQHNNQAWENWQYPTAYVNPPAYPLPPGSTCGVNLFCAGSGATGFQVFSNELRAHGWNLDSQDTYLSSDFDLIEDYQDAVGVQVDGVVGPQTWNQAFQLGQNADVLADAYIRELWSVNAVQPYLLNSRGAVVGINPNFDPSAWRRREKLVDYGVLDKATARVSAKLDGNQHKLPYFVGTVTARNIDPHEMAALDTYSGMNMRLLNHRGQTRILHVVKRDVQTGMTAGGGQADRVVTWTVSEQPDDMMSLAQILARKQGVRDLVHNNRPQRRSAHRTPDWVPFDSESGAGIQIQAAQFAGLWNVYWVPMGEAVDVNAVKLVADRPTLIAAAMFNQRITPAHLQTLPGLSNPSAGTADPWAANTNALNALGIQWATGGPDAMQGYWPNDPGGAITGVLADTSPWAFRTTRPPYGYLAVWTSVSCEIGGDPTQGYRAIFPAPEH